MSKYYIGDKYHTPTTYQKKVKTMVYGAEGHIKTVYEDGTIESTIR